MLIRSQNKTSLTNLNTIAAVAIHEGIGNKWHISIIMQTVGTREPMKVIVATYSTEAKAIKVLDMIQEAYIAQKSKLLWCEILRSGILSDVSAESLIDTWNVHTSSIAFDMPADEEVEA